MSVIETVATTGNKPAGHRIHYFPKGGPASMALTELDARAGHLAHRLREAGLRRGDRVGILARNGLGWVLLDLAAIKAGLVTAGFEVGKFRDPAALAAAYALRALYADPAVPGGVPDGVIDVGPLVEEAIAADAGALAIPADPPRYGPLDITTIKFTSGSTGEPKGLGATVGSIDGSLAGVQSLFHHGASDNILVFLPLSLLQQRYWIYSALTYGHDVTVASFEIALDVAGRLKPTVIMGVPGFFDSIKKHLEARGRLAPDDREERRRRIDALLGGRIRYLWTGSAPANPAMLAFFNDCGVAIYEGYGMNETCIVTKNAPGRDRPGSAGRPLPGKRLRIDENGVLIVGSDHPVNTAYAHCAPGDSERVFLPGGEVRTGDLARIDEDGYLHILGRADDLVVLANGRNVHVRTIEERVRQHAAVGECILFGSGKPFLVAVVAPAAAAPGADDRAAIQAHIDAVNGSLHQDERIVRTFIAPDPFSVASGLLTSQFKPRRKEIFKMYGQEIAKLYGVAA